jgi:hypothetical protein
MSEDRLHSARIRAMHAQELVDNEMLTEAFQKLEMSYIEAWKSTGVHDEKGREKLFLAVNVIGKLKEHLKSVIADGKLADAQLKKMIDDQERRRLFGFN